MGFLFEELGPDSPVFGRWDHRFFWHLFITQFGLTDAFLVFHWTYKVSPSISRSCFLHRSCANAAPRSWQATIWILPVGATSGRCFFIYRAYRFQKSKIYLFFVCLLQTAALVTSFIATAKLCAVTGAFAIIGMPQGPLLYAEVSAPA